MSETGSIKFRCEQVPAKIFHFAGLADLNRYRRKLIKLGVVGVDANGIGFGNISVRDGNTSQFYITGSGTGGIAELTVADCAKVAAYDFAANWLRCEGETVASSESLTHAAVYESDPTAGAVIHVHDTNLWSALLDQAPTTSRTADYGTPEMACAVRHLFENTDVKAAKIFVMAAHAGGIVAFGAGLEEAFRKLQIANTGEEATCDGIRA